MFAWLWKRSRRKHTPFRQAIILNGNVIEEEYSDEIEARLRTRGDGSHETHTITIGPNKIEVIRTWNA